MQQQNTLSWDDAPMPLNSGLHLRHHALFYSRLTRRNLLSDISTYKIDTEQPTDHKAELVMEEAGV